MMTIRKLALAAVAALAAVPAAANPLAKYAWSARPVLVFAKSPEDAAFKRQMALFAAARRDLADREMPVIAVAGDRVTVNGRRSSLSAAALRRKARVEGATATVLLYGKDTGEKFRGRAVVRPSRLFALVDRMPMRRREMRERSGG